VGSAEAVRLRSRESTDEGMVRIWVLTTEDKGAWKKIS
jgi:hypothetical protein